MKPFVFRPGQTRWPNNSGEVQHIIHVWHLEIHHSLQLIYLQLLTTRSSMLSYLIHKCKIACKIFTFVFLRTLFIGTVLLQIALISTVLFSTYDKHAEGLDWILGLTGHFGINSLCFKILYQRFLNSEEIQVYLGPFHSLYRAVTHECIVDIIVMKFCIPKEYGRV